MKSRSNDAEIFRKCREERNHLIRKERRADRTNIERQKVGSSGIFLFSFTVIDCFAIPGTIRNQARRRKQLWQRSILSSTEFGHLSTEMQCTRHWR